MKFMSFVHWCQDQLDVAKSIDFLAPLALRVYLFFPFWMAGTTKLASFDSTVAWFGNSEWGLGLPMPELMAFLATWTEIIGALFILTGFATRYISIPLMVTMLVAVFAVHWDNGWYAIAQSDADPEVAERLSRARDILRENGNYAWLTAKGNFVVLNNGVEFAVTYLIMLLVLFFNGAGKYLSVDYWIKSAFRPES